MKLEDIIFSFKTGIVRKGKVNPGVEMVAIYPFDDKKCIYAEHDYVNTKITEDFKERALNGIRFKVEEFLKNAQK